MGHVDRKDPLREYNVPGEQLSLQLHAFFASFIRFFIFFCFLFFPFLFFSFFFPVLFCSFYHRIFYLFLKTRFAAVSIQQYLDVFGCFVAMMFKPTSLQKTRDFFHSLKIEETLDRSSKKHAFVTVFFYIEKQNGHVNFSLLD